MSDAALPEIQSVNQVAEVHEIARGSVDNNVLSEEVVEGLQTCMVVQIGFHPFEDMFFVRLPFFRLLGALCLKPQKVEEPSVTDSTTLKN